ncbi:MAG: outer membrane beta-barrel protein [Candidatus Azobacteroides sp.]|nr:outer membrane beta-barrel protein [Candidatus Azobacteroides sp.]
MKSLKVILIFLFCSFTLFGQKNLSITGTIVDDATKEPVDFATVSLLNAKDNSFVSGSMSNTHGIFTLQNLSKGKYIISVTYVGYKAINKPITLSGNSPTTNAGKIALITDDVLLKEAVIEGKAPEVVVKNDTLEFNADSFKTPQNSAVEDLLKKLPGTEVDKDGNITVNGKSIKKILVEGKEFFSDDPTVASKNLPAEMVKKVQVIDRKSDMARITGFDDGSEETVINLTIQEGMKKGTMGNAMAGLGHDIISNGDNNGNLRYETGAMVNHMTNSDRYTLIMGANNTNNMGAADLGGSRFSSMRGMRRGSGGINTSENFAANINKDFSPNLSLNGDISYNGSERDSHNTTVTDYNKSIDKQTRDSIKLRDKTISDNKDISDNFSVRFRMEWKPDTNTTIIFRPSFSYNKSNSWENKDFTNSNTLLSSIEKDTLFDGQSTSHNWGEGYQVGGSLEYARRLNKPGRVISASVNGNYNTSYSRGEYNNFMRIYNGGIYNRDSVVTQQLENDNYSKMYGFTVTYVEPIGRNNFVQASYRLTKNYSENINSTYNLDTIPNPNEWNLNKQQSRSNVRDNLTQRINLSFRSMREKYNYTIGLNIDPSRATSSIYVPSTSGNSIQAPHEGRFPNIMGDTLASLPVNQNIVNYSPTLNFNYLFGRRTNLRIDYSGDMTQPTANQLSILDESNPMNIIKGNSDLKPSYSSSFSARFSKFVPESQFFYYINLQGNFSLNDIVQVLYITPSTGGRITTYKNINGNWDSQLRGMFNTPLRNKKFTIGNYTTLSYRNLMGYTNEVQNTTKNFTASERANANYRSDLFDLGINGGISYQNVNNKLQPENNANTYDYSAGGYTTWYLPHNFTVDSDVDCQIRRGYFTGYNTSQIIWNAAISKQIFNSKAAGAGTLKLKVYDILQDRKSLSYTVGSNSITNRESSTMPSFFMFSFIYKFQKFPGGKASAKDMDPGSMRYGSPDSRGPGDRSDGRSSGDRSSGDRGSSRGGGRP